MNAKPTEGPYTVCTGTGISSGLYTITDPKGNVIVSRMKGEANAILLAASWEMREAVADLLTVLEVYTVGNRMAQKHLGENQTVQDARALLARIDGTEGK